MALTNAYYPHAIIFNDAYDDIFQLTNPVPNFGDNEIAEMCASGIGPEYLGIKHMSPDMTFDTKQIGAMLSRYSSIMNIAADYSAGNVDLQYLAGENLGVRIAAASTEHIRARFTNNALAFWTSLNSSQEQDAEISNRIITAWDGSAASPLIWSSGVAASADCDVTELYGLGPVSVNGSVIQGVTSVQWNLNVEIETIQSDGEAYDSYQAIKTIKPEVVIKTHHLDYMSLFGNFGSALASTGLVHYLRAHDEAAIFKANGTAAHIKLSATDGKVRVRRAASSPAECEISVRLKKQSNGNFFDVTIGTTIT